ncbi:MAG: hypothetical protein R2712_23525 [Vicinamibacterales bacterium]
MTAWLSRRLRWVLAVTWVVAGVALAAATVFDVRSLWPEPPTPPEVVRDLTVRHVPDQQGRRASFRIMLFSDEFRWRLSSYDSIEDSASLPAFTDEMKAVLNSAREIISIGASSEEIPSGTSSSGGRAREEWRAARRADRIALWIRGALTKPIPVRKLNIGHHLPTTAGGDTSDQRRVVIILVLDQDDEVNVDEALRAAMLSEADRAPILHSLLTNYSLGSGDTFTWVP